MIYPTAAGLVPGLPVEVLSGTQPRQRGREGSGRPAPQTAWPLWEEPRSMTPKCPPVFSLHGRQRPRAGSRDFLRPMRMGGVAGTQGSPFLCRSDTCSSFLRKEEVDELISKAKITLEHGGLGGQAWGQFRVPDEWDLHPHLWAAPGAQLLSGLTVNAEMPPGSWHTPREGIVLCVNTTPK